MPIAATGADNAAGMAIAGANAGAADTAIADGADARCPGTETDGADITESADGETDIGTAVTAAAAANEREAVAAAPVTAT